MRSTIKGFLLLLTAVFLLAGCSAEEYTPSWLQTDMGAKADVGALESAGKNASLPKESIGDIVSAEQYEEIFPGHVPFYSYEGFVQGGNAVEGFCTTGDKNTRIRECAAFLANAGHETGNGGHVRETKCLDYQDATQKGACAPVPKKKYCGRGLMQVTWNYNYCAASKFIFGDNGGTLVKDPGILERDAAVSTQASLWYWMTQASAGPMPSHDCITSGDGFGCTIRAINGGIECDGQKPELVQSRVDNYLRILDILGEGKVKPVGKNGC